MEVANKRHTAYSSATRMYSPTKGSSAYAYAQEAVAPQPQPQPKPQQKPVEKHATRQKARQEMSLGCRWALLCSILLLAGASVAVVFRYADIATQYAQVNQLKSDIESAKLRVRELNVALECSVSIQDAQDAAKRFHMTYPTASQYVRAGDALVLDQGAGSDEDENTNAGANTNAEQGGA